MTLFTGGTGKLIRISTLFDMSANTGLQITFTKPDDTTLVVTNPEVTAPGVPVTDSVLGPLLANQYLEYTLKQDDLSLPGIWRFKGEAQLSSTVRAVGDYRTVTVLE